MDRENRVEVLISALRNEYEKYSCLEHGCELAVADKTINEAKMQLIFANRDASKAVIIILIGELLEAWNACI